MTTLNLDALKMIIEAAVLRSTKQVLSESLVEIVKVAVGTAIEKQQTLIKEIRSLREEVGQMRQMLTEGYTPTYDDLGEYQTEPVMPIVESRQPRRQQGVVPRRQQAAFGATPLQEVGGMTLTDMIKDVDPERMAQNSAGIPRDFRGMQQVGQTPGRGMERGNDFPVAGSAPARPAPRGHVAQANASAQELSSALDALF